MEFNKLGNVINGIRHLSGREFLSIPPDEAVLLDVRPEYELSRLFDVPNIIYCPYDEILSKQDELPDDIYLVLADAAGLRSREKAAELMHRGYTNIGNLAGGIVEWERAGLPVSLDRSKILTGSCMCQLRVRKKSQ